MKSVMVHCATPSRPWPRRMPSWMPRQWRPARTMPRGWHFKFRRKKDTTESFQLRKRQLTSSAPWFAALFGGVADRSTMHSRRPLPAEFATDTRLLHDKRCGRYYLIIALPPSSSQPPLGPKDDSQVLAEPAAMDVDGREEEEECRLVSIDPGVRTFATCFDPRGFCTKWGEHASLRLWTEANKLHAFIKEDEQGRPVSSHLAPHASCPPTPGAAHPPSGRRVAPQDGPVALCQPRHPSCCQCSTTSRRPRSATPRPNDGSARSPRRRSPSSTRWPIIASGNSCNTRHTTTGPASSSSVRPTPPRPAHAAAPLAKSAWQRCATAGHAAIESIATSAPPSTSFCSSTTMPPRLPQHHSYH